MDVEIKQFVLAIDLGGTKISGAIVDSDLSVVVQRTIPSRGSIQGIADPELLGAKKLISDLCLQAERANINLVYGVGGFPEYVDLKGMLTSADNIDWRVQPQEDFALLTGFPWISQSDVRCAGIAEALQGAGRGESDFVYVTISSGISHTHFLGGIAVTGASGEAIGFGMRDVKILENIHILENYSSGLGIARRYAQASQDLSLDAKSLMDRFETDELAREVITTACEVLGAELAKFLSHLSTPVLVLGGGLWLGSEKFRELTLNSFKSACQLLNFHPTVRDAEVEHSGVIGAAIYGFAELT